MRVIATAGHVDHGKSTLVEALTGTDPDRLAEEKHRGMTIDLGFAHCRLPGGEEVAFVDVPGHGRLVKNMLAGVGAVDACLFVVAATEGWKEQSEEHLRILELLGIGHGVVALTKVGLLDADTAELAALEVAERTAGTFLEGAEVVPVDAPAGLGVERLAAALARLVASTPAAADSGRSRLWVDRSFPIRGAGTVVTGTLTGGSLAVGDEVLVVPGGRKARVRALQSHNVGLDRAGPGRRLAVNLSGLSHEEVRRGQALVRPGQWHAAGVVDASLAVLTTVEHPVGRRGAYIAYLGSAEVPVRLRLLGPAQAAEGGGRGPGDRPEGAAIGPGKAGFVRLWLATRGWPLVPGDRYVLREAGRDETVGGGVLLDVEPVLPASRARPSISVERVVAERGWVDIDELERLTGRRVPPVLGHWAVDPAALSEARRRLRDLAAEAGRSGLDLAALDERLRAAAAAGVEGVLVRSGRAYLEGLAGTGPSPEARDLLDRLRAGGMRPPDLPPTERRALRELERLGLAVQAGEVWFSAEAVEAAARALGRLLASNPAGFTVSQAREALGITRKHAVPLLEHLDRQGVTRRRGDLRVAGPRMPSPVASHG